MGVAVLIAVISIGLALALAAAVPAGLPYDEPSHLSVVRFFTTHPWRLPIIGADGATYEAQNGPIYYALAALAARLGASIGLPDVAAVRGATALLAGPIAFLGYRLARALGIRHIESLAAALFLGLDASLAAIAASVQDDSLSIVLAEVAMLLALRLMRTDAPQLGAGVVLGLLIGLSVLTKATAFYLGATLPICVLLGRGRLPDTARVRVVAAVIATTAVTTGWWLVRNLVVYGDLTARKPLKVYGFAPRPLSASSVLHYGQTAFAYLWTPTEYYRNFFHTPGWVVGSAVVVTVAAGAGLAAAAYQRDRYMSMDSCLFVTFNATAAIVAWLVSAATVSELAFRTTFTSLPLFVIAGTLGAARFVRVTHWTVGAGVILAALVATAGMDAYVLVVTRGIHFPP